MSGPADAGLGYGHLVSTAQWYAVKTVQWPAREGAMGPLKGGEGRVAPPGPPGIPAQLHRGGRDQLHIGQVLLCFRTRFGSFDWVCGRRGWLNKVRYFALLMAESAPHSLSMCTRAGWVGSRQVGTLGVFLLVRVLLFPSPRGSLGH